MWIDQRGSHVLPLSECVRLLALGARKGLIGRLAVSQHGAPLVQPFNFAYQDRQIVVRIGPGHMASVAPGSLVAFEVDHVDDGSGRAWSVVVRGLATLIVFPVDEEPQHSIPVPLVPRPGDIVLGIRLDVVSGRRFPLGVRLPNAASHAQRRLSGATSSEVAPGEPVHTGDP